MFSSMFQVHVYIYLCVHICVSQCAWGGLRLMSGILCAHSSTLLIEAGSLSHMQSLPV